MSFSEMLGKLMKDNSTSALALAKAVGVSDVTVGKWLKGEAVPNLNNAIEVARHYGISLDELSGVESKLSSNKYFKLPVLGFANNVAVGLYRKIYDQYIEVTNFDLDGYPRDECYALKVDGDSLEPKFQRGFYLIVHQQRICRNNDIVIFMDDKFNNQIKLFKQFDDHIELSCLSGTYKDIIFTNQNINKIFIQGVVVSDYYPC
jgi:SOS-response transcriptional repressor LexA